MYPKSREPLKQTAQTEEGSGSSAALLGDDSRDGSEGAEGRTAADAAANCHVTRPTRGGTWQVRASGPSGEGLSQPQEAGLLRSREKEGAQNLREGTWGLLSPPSVVSVGFPISCRVGGLGGGSVAELRSDPRCDAKRFKNVEEILCHHRADKMTTPAFLHAVGTAEPASREGARLQPCSSTAGSPGRFWGAVFPRSVGRA